MIQHLFRKIIRKYISLYRNSIRHCSQKFVELPSDLYIFKRHRNVFSTFDPFFDIEKTFKNIEKLKLDLTNRNLKVDVDYLNEQSVLYLRIASLMKEIEKEIAAINSELKLLLPEDRDKGEEPLKNKLSQAELRLQVTLSEYASLEDSFILPFLRLPNRLHKNTTKKDEVLFTLFDRPPNVEAPCTVIAGEELELRPDVAPSAYYLKGRLSAVELAVTEFAASRFRELGFCSESLPDTCKSTLLEGCGIETRRSDSAINIYDDEIHASTQRLYLTGGASLPAFVSIFYHGMVNLKSSPVLRLVTIGRKYDAANLDACVSESKSTLLQCGQSTSVSGFVAYSTTQGAEEAVVNEIAMSITQLYTDLGLHFTLVQYGASHLHSYESLAVGIRMFSPHLRSYVEVGRISLCHDFISKRLQIYQKMDKHSAAFLGMAYVEVLNAPKWISCMVENTHSSNHKYVIPDCIRPFLYE